MAESSKKTADHPVETLTRLERGILALLVKDLTNPEIARELTLALSTVKWYTRQIYGKLGVNNRRQAAARARELGLLDGLTVQSPRPAPQHNLPRQLTTFIGRENEIAQVKGLLEKHALVTLTGSGGVGKTRLALKVAQVVLESYPDGVWLANLAPLSESGLLAQSVAAVVGLREEAGNPIQETLVDFLREKRALIILDNCEHLLSACAELAAYLLAACSQLNLLASSREALRVTGEIAYRVPSMSFPDQDKLPELDQFQEYEAVRLFVERANTALPGFQVTGKNAATVMQICQRLDGIPLALELAAARLSMLTAEQLASRLDHAFLLLTGGSRAGLPRHQTLRATIDWSYQLLSTQEQVLLRRLAVFAGGCALEAIEATCAGEGLETENIFDLLSGLVSKSMVSVERKQDEETRYRLLETVRQYAREKLDEAKERRAFHDRHLEYFRTLAEAVEPQLRTPIALERLQALRQDVDNFRAALAWALDDPGKNKIEDGLRLASALLYFWHTQSFHKEGYTWLLKGLSVAQPVLVDPRVRAKACFSAGHLILPLSRTAEARHWIQESLEMYRRLEDPGGVVMAQSMLGEVAAWSGSRDEARELCEASLAVCRSINEPWLIAWVLCRCGMIFFHLGEDALSRPLLEESLEIFEHLGDVLQVADHFISLGYLAYNRGDLTAASAYYQKALTNARVRQSQWTEAIVLRHLGMIAYRKREYQQMQSYLLKSVFIQRENMKFPNYETTLSYIGSAELNLGHLGQAARYFKESLNISTEPEDITAALIGVARAALWTNQPQAAAQLLGACQRYIQVDGVEIGDVVKREYDLGWAETQAHLEAPACEEAITKGRALTMDQAVKYALSIELTEAEE